jgi:hypothetical protein
MKKFLFLLTLLLIAFSLKAQTYLLGPESFSSDFMVHGSTASTTVWFAPDYHTPIDWIATGGNPDGHLGYSAAWNSYWGNFVRLPQVNCSGNDTVILTLDFCNSYFAANPNDWVRFYLWDQGASAYRNNVSSIKINGVESLVNFGANGFGFRFNEARSWAHVEVKFYLTNVTDKSNVLFYIEPACQYNNSSLFAVKMDNIGIIANPVTTAVSESVKTLWQVGPNPASGSLIVHGSCPAIAEVLDLCGRLLQTARISDGQQALDVSVLSEGVYLLKLTADNGSQTICKIMISR